ncbi:hypothetical protein [Pseudonocardia parietis]|uniref:DUF4190 domain-containing protein n=1 Tax=Pseudonocardia parietis TaxID=570936 RepID=A0ABS4VMD5_9PSEU|nr:hypothetical protein [Pseudonocardia parietis]MBP2365067.1 hypothetical protein [Pseudonocardia parietis]
MAEEPEAATVANALGWSVVLLVFGWLVGLVLLPVPLLTSAFGITLVNGDRTAWGTALYVLHIVTLVVTGSLLAILGLALVFT